MGFAFLFFCVPSCISGVHHSSSSVFPAISLGFAFFFFFSLCVPQLDLWDSPFWENSLRMSPFSNPTIEVVTFRLRGWCMLGVFLLPAFIRLGHECQDLLSPCDGMHVFTDQTSVYTLTRKRVFFGGVGGGGGGMESKPMLTPREKSPLPEKFSSKEDGTHDAASSSTASPTHYQLSYPGPGKEG